MSIVATRRALLGLAGAASLSAAMAGAVRAEGGSSTASAGPGFANGTPVSIGAAALRVLRRDTMTAFYRDAIGLSLLAEADGRSVLGVDGIPLLTLIDAPDASFEPPTQAGLFHIAFLMPERRDLAQWLVHAAYTRVPLSGFADHNVSEAVYLDDPEGNGLEIYADRPADRWEWKDGVVTMGTHQLDMDAILDLTTTERDTYRGAPAGLRIGHIHLRVGDIPAGRGFYEKALGLASTRGDRRDAAFLSSGGYHHHVALNVWNSAGAGRRDPRSTGLDWFSLRVREAAIVEAQSARLAAGGLAVTPVENGVEALDPWGTRVRLLSGAA
ncbi:VOC family protein [Pseudochelatococcus lubricantis]|uniref:VOC family protein n=1 Tax=Pseudochelatococcus lubricantis TaxID=1538102 RepID=UPI0035EE9899